MEPSKKLGYLYTPVPLAFIQNIGQQKISPSAVILAIYLMAKQGPHKATWVSHRRAGFELGWYVGTNGICQRFLRAIKELKAIGLRVEKISRPSEDGVVRLENHFDTRPMMANFIKMDTDLLPIPTPTRKGKVIKVNDPGITAPMPVLGVSDPNPTVPMAVSMSNGSEQLEKNQGIQVPAQKLTSPPFLTMPTYPFPHGTVADPEPTAPMPPSPTAPMIQWAGSEEERVAADRAAAKPKRSRLSPPPPPVYPENFPTAKPTATYIYSAAELIESNPTAPINDPESTAPMPAVSDPNPTAPMPLAEFVMPEAESFSREVMIAELKQLVKDDPSLMAASARPDSEIPRKVIKVPELPVNPIKNETPIEFIRETMKAQFDDWKPKPDYNIYSREHAANKLDSKIHPRTKLWATIKETVVFMKYGFSNERLMTLVDENFRAGVDDPKKACLKIIDLIEEEEKMCRPEEFAAIQAESHRFNTYEYPDQEYPEEDGTIN